MLLMMIEMLKNAMTSPFNQRKLTYNRVIRIYLKLKRLESNLIK